MLFELFLQKVISSFFCGGRREKVLRPYLEQRSFQVKIAVNERERDIASHINT
jgi:hypothetical protein